MARDGPSRSGTEWGIIRVGVRGSSGRRPSGVGPERRHMNGTNARPSVSIGKLITIPAMITLVLTILRLIGELQHWPKPWVSSAAGGGGAIIGIFWLPLIFGPYFAWKLAAAGDGPASAGKAIGMSALGLVVLLAGGAAFGIGLSKHMVPLIVLGLLLALASALVRERPVGLRLRRPNPGTGGNVHRHERQRRSGLEHALRRRGSGFRGHVVLPE